MSLRFLLPFFLLSIFILSLSQGVSSSSSSSSSDQLAVETDESDQPQVVKGSSRRLLPFIDCEKLCEVRCGAHSRPNVCTRACGTCCARCKCVPPGTYGNRELCGKCYTDMLTHGNKPKCP